MARKIAFAAAVAIMALFAAVGACTGSREEARQPDAATPPVQTASAADSDGITFEECKTVYGEVWLVRQAPFVEPGYVSGMSDRCKVALEEEVLRRLRAGENIQDIQGL